MNTETLRQHFTPGNVIKSHYWGTYDLVIAFHEPKDGMWSVTVQHCDENGIPIDGRKRNHATYPDKRDQVIKGAL